MAKRCKIDRLTTDQGNTSVWTWAAWIERSGVRRFVYGCAARSTREVGWQANPEMRELPGLTLGIQQATIGETAFEEVCRRLNDGEIDLRAVFGADTPVTAICATRHLLEAVLGQTAAPVTAYYTMPTLAELLDNDEAALLPLLDALECELRLPFKSSYAARLGNFECFDLHPWLDRSQPFLIEAQRVDLEGGNAVYRIGRTPEFAAIKHMAHVVGRVNGDVVVNRLVDLPVGQEELVFDVPERLDELEFSLFEAAGRIVHSEKSTFMNRVGLVLAPIHRRVQVDDDLSRRAGPSRQGASIVAAHSSMRSLVGAPETGSWRKFAEDMTDVVAQHTSSPSEDRWFPRGIDGEVGAIAYFNQLLSGGIVRRAVIADPWFGAEALHQLALRLTSTDLEITVLTSWLDVDPDTGLPLDPALSIERLHVTLEQVRLFINPKLTLLNLIDGRERAFHDRYLLLYPHEGPSRVFLLSNSLNAAGRNWPFSISLMGADVTRSLREYVEGLVAGKDVTRSKDLTINLRWSTRVQPAAG